MVQLFKESNLNLEFKSYNYLQLFLSDFASCLLCKKHLSSCPHFEGTHCLFEDDEFPVFDTQIEIKNAVLNEGEADQ